MLDYIGGTEIHLQVTFAIDGEPVIPDVGSVTYSVRDHTGALVTGLVDIPVVTTAATFSVVLTVPATANTIAAGKRFERRSAIVSYRYLGLSRTLALTYRLVPFFNHSVTPQSVRSFLGVKDYELANDDLDLIASYLAVEADVGADVLLEALASGTTLEIAANECIRMRAVLDVMPSLKNRVAQSERNGPMGFERPTIRDFSHIEKEARERYAAARRETRNVIEEQLSLVLVTQDVDPITGA